MLPCRSRRSNASKQMTHYPNKSHKTFSFLYHNSSSVTISDKLEFKSSPRREPPPTLPPSPPSPFPLPPPSRKMCEGGGGGGGPLRELLTRADPQNTVLQNLYTAQHSHIAIVPHNLLKANTSDYPVMGPRVPSLL